MKKISKSTLVVALMLILSLAFPSGSIASAQTEPVTKAVVIEASKTPTVLSNEPAKQEKCLFSPLKPIGPAPLKVTFYADYNGSDVDSYLWTFGDGSTSNSAVGPVVEHTFSGENTDPHIKLQVWFHDGTSVQCSTWGQIKEPTQAVVPVATQTPPIPPTGNNTAAGNGTSATIDVEGDNNASNSINCGNGCEITINNYPTDPVAPVTLAGQKNSLDKVIDLIKWLTTELNK
jgi:hypothetical protein